MKVGDRVTWMYTPGGGYAYEMPVAAIVLRLTPKCAVVRIARKIGTEWRLEERTVRQARLRPRDKPARELGEIE